MFKPYDLADLAVNVSSRPRTVEVISRPIPSGSSDPSAVDTIKVRMVPGEPTTMVEVFLDRLAARPKQRWLHVAEVECRFTFPEDMLRYDSAFLFDSELWESGQDGEGLRGGPWLVYRLNNSKRSAGWSLARWASFGATVTHKLTRDLRHPEAAVVG